MRKSRPYPISLCAALMVLLSFAGTVSGQDYIAYYQAVASAEETAVLGRYSDALQQYETIFSAYPYNNPLDCYIAAQLAACTKDSTACRDLLRRGLCFGLPETCIQGNPHLKDHMPGTATSDSCKALYRSRIRPEARARIISLFQYDQSIVLAPGTSLYQPGTFVLKAPYQAVWDSLLAEIVQLTQQYGFPAQKIAGTQQGDDAVLKPSPHSVFAYFILLHHRQAWPAMQQLLLPELRKGNITPQVYAALADNSNGHSDEHRMQYFALRPCGSKVCKTIVQQRMAGINAARLAIGLCSYEVMERKHRFTRRYYAARSKKQTDSTAIDFQPDLHFMGQ